MSSKEITVYISLGSEHIRVGRLWCHLRKGRESASFEYDREWLKHPERFALEPALHLTEGTFHTKTGIDLFGSIGDSSPDRWGRMLMRRQESKRSKNERETARTLFESDYLLGVNDEARQGALRFIEKEDGEFLIDKDKGAIPPLIDLSKLLAASQNFLDGSESFEDLKILLAPGSSLGGARPKASINDKNGNLSIAKFPRKDDEFDFVAWEAVALALAERAGIKVPSWRLQSVLDKRVLIVNRFDRIDNNLRIPFLSSMSMLEAKDNEQRSYLEIAYAISQHGASPESDLAELWRRIIFTILISNTDDHLRNHGFLYEQQKGWSLSPVYDINPTPLEIKPRILTTAIDFNNSDASLDVALSIIDDFRLSMNQAKAIVRDVAESIIQWRKIAKSFGLKKNDIDGMSSAFEHDDLKKARQI